MFDFPNALADYYDDFEPVPEKVGGYTPLQRRIQKALGNRKNKQPVWWFLIPEEPDLEPNVSLNRLLLTIGDHMGRWGLWNWPRSYTKSPTIKPTEIGYFHPVRYPGLIGQLFWGFIIPSDMQPRHLDELMELCRALGYTPSCDTLPVNFGDSSAYYQYLL